MTENLSLYLYIIVALKHAQNLNFKHVYFNSHYKIQKWKNWIVAILHPHTSFKVCNHLLIRKGSLGLVPDDSRYSQTYVLSCKTRLQIS